MFCQYRSSNILKQFKFFKVNDFLSSSHIANKWNLCKIISTPSEILDIPNRRISHNSEILVNNVSLLPFKNVKRFKYKKSKAEEEDSNSDSDDDIEDAYSKLINGHMTSLRTDLILKTGLGIARNKVETMFYESRIRVNGHKILKKSMRVNVKDEIDVVKGVCPANDSLITVARVVIVKSQKNEEGDGIIVKLKRYKNINIENYPGEDEWKG